MKISDPLQDVATERPKQHILCNCGLKVGIPIAFWEPARVVDVTRIPFCMVNLGGMKIGTGIGNAGYVSNKQGGDESKKKSFYHVHWYIYPLLAWLQLIEGLACITESPLDTAKQYFDVLYLSELDPTWDDDELTMIFNPEGGIFANLLAMAACVPDCAASSFGLPLDSMYWCSGCRGSIFPLNGNIVDHSSGANSSTLITERLIFKLHRMFLEMAYMGPKARCGPYFSPNWKKRQYKLQMTYPRANKGFFACNPIGRSTFVWDRLKEFPYKGEDFAYLIWRRRDCCVL